MRHFKVTSILLIAFFLTGCGIFGGSDGTDVTVAEDVIAEPTVNSVQAVPAATAPPAVFGDAGDDAEGTDDTAGAPLPTAVTLPTAAPTPEPTVDRSQPITYIVQSGDVLGLIAERFDADIAELRRVNNLNGNLINVGQELTIPALEGATGATDESAAPAAAATSAPAPAATSAPAAPVTCNSAAAGHCVQPGETLLGIALQYDVTVDALRTANPGVSNDLIKSGEILNLPGASTSTDTTTTDTTTTDTTTTTTDTTTTVDPAPTVGPRSDADCAARNPEFPYYHAADGLCYANPIGATVVPTAAPGTTATPDVECPEGTFLWEDGLCYPIPGATVEPTPGGTPTSGPAAVQPDYGKPPCRDGYVELVATNKCWPEATNTNPTTVTPVPSS